MTSWQYCPILLKCVVDYCMHCAEYADDLTSASSAVDLSLRRPPATPLRTSSLGVLGLPELGSGWRTTRSSFSGTRKENLFATFCCQVSTTTKLLQMGHCYRGRRLQKKTDVYGLDWLNKCVTYWLLSIYCKGTTITDRRPTLNHWRHICRHCKVRNQKIETFGKLYDSTQYLLPSPPRVHNDSSFFTPS